MDLDRKQRIQIYVDPNPEHRCIGLGLPAPIPPLREDVVNDILERQKQFLIKRRLQREVAAK